VPTKKKNETIDGLRGRVAASPNLFFTDMRGLTVTELRTLRVSLSKESTSYAVVKNTLFRIAIGDARRTALASVLEGPTGVAFVGDDPVGAAKALTQFARDSKKLSIKAGYIDGRLLDPTDVEGLSKIPRRPELLSKLVGSLKSPLYGLVGVLGGNQRKLVQLLEAVRIKKSETEPAVA